VIVPWCILVVLWRVIYCDVYVSWGHIYIRELFQWHVYDPHLPNTSWNTPQAMIFNSSGGKYAWSQSQGRSISLCQPIVKWKLCWFTARMCVCAWMHICVCSAGRIYCWVNSSYVCFSPFRCTISYPVVDPLPSFIPQSIDNSRGEMIAARNHDQFLTIHHPTAIRSQGVVDTFSIRRIRGGPLPKEGIYSLYCWNIIVFTMT
jgi:hypothetical protein